MRTMKFVTTLERDEDGVWIAECPSIPGCVSQGKTREEALTNIREAIAACLEVRAERGLPLTVETRQVEVVLRCPRCQHSPGAMSSRRSPRMAGRRCGSDHGPPASLAGTIQGAVLARRQCRRHGRSRNINHGIDYVLG